MANIEDLIKFIDEFNTLYPRPDMPKLILSENYDVRSHFYKPYPGANLPGVYIIFSSSGNILRIGKASCGSSLGKRLACYYKWGDSGQEGLHKYEGYEDAKLLRTISFPKKRAFEAPALEEYLINKLKPPYNKTGT